MVWDDEKSESDDIVSLASAHKRRMVGTFVAVFLGVAFLSGTLALGDTLRANFDNLFTDANAGTDAVIRHSSELSSDPGEPDLQRGLIPQSLVGTCAGSTAWPRPTVVEGFGEIVGKDGDGHRTGRARPSSPATGSPTPS